MRPPSEEQQQQQEEEQRQQQQQRVLAALGCTPSAIRAAAEQAQEDEAADAAIEVVEVD